MNDIEEIKSAIRGLLQDAAIRGVLIDRIEVQYASRLGGDATVTSIWISETRTKT